MSSAFVRFGKYSIVGSLTFLLDLLLLFFLVDVLLIHQVWAVGIAFLIAVSVNYIISRKFVFAGTLRSIQGGYVNFLGIALVGIIIVVCGMFIMTTWLHVHYLIAHLCTAFITGFWNYLMNLYVNFKVAEHQ